MEKSWRGVKMEQHDGAFGGGNESPRILVGSRAGDGGLAVWGGAQAQDASQQQTKETREKKRVKGFELLAFQSQL